LHPRSNSTYKYHIEKPRSATIMKKCTFNRSQWTKSKHAENLAKKPELGEYHNNRSDREGNRKLCVLFNEVSCIMFF
jgi:hypothetical protein